MGNDHQSMLPDFFISHLSAKKQLHSTKQKTLKERKEAKKEQQKEKQLSTRGLSSTYPVIYSSEWKTAVIENPNLIYFYIKDTFVCFEFFYHFLLPSGAIYSTRIILNPTLIGRNRKEVVVLGRFTHVHTPAGSSRAVHFFGWPSSIAVVCFRIRHGSILEVLLMQERKSPVNS
jgi:hypothetical protein